MLSNLQTVKIFNFIAFLASFPSGCFLADLIEIVENQRVLWDLPDNVLQGLLVVSVINAGGSPKQAVQNLKSLPSEDILNSILEQSILNPKAWIRVRQERVGREDKTLIVMNGVVKEVINRLALSERVENLTFKALVNNLVFHQLLLTSIIKNSMVFEDIIDGSSLNKSLVWQMPAYSLKSLPHIETEGMSKSNMRSIFNHYETNYAALLSEKSSISLVGGLTYALEVSDDEVKQKYLELVEDVIVKILTVSKIFGHGIESQDYGLEVQNLYKTASAQTLLSRLHFKVEYWQAERLFNLLKLSSANISVDNKEKLVESIKNLEYIVSNTIVDDGFNQL